MFWFLLSARLDFASLENTRNIVVNKPIHSICSQSNKYYQIVTNKMRFCYCFLSRIFSWQQRELYVCNKIPVVHVFVLLSLHHYRYIPGIISWFALLHYKRQSHTCEIKQIIEEYCQWDTCIYICFHLEYQESIIKFLKCIYYISQKNVQSFSQTTSYIIL